MLSKDEVQAALLRKLKESCLTKNDATALGFTAYTADEVAAKPKLEVAPPAAGFVIPYYDIKQKYTDFFRFRYLEQPQYAGFNGSVAHDIKRYTQPKGERPRVYFSPLLPWPRFFATPAEQPVIYITEGENKANCACKMGYPTLALGGVWNFMSKREGVWLLPELADLPLKDYKIYIVYDSDIIKKPDVLRAENELARELLKLGWKIFTLRLPSGPEDAKMGLDDYLRIKGGKAFDKLVAEAREWEKSRQLHELNEKVLFLRESSTVLELETRYRWRATEFANAVYANRIYKVTEGEGKKARTVEKSASHEWLKWDCRAQLESVTYAPGGPLIVGDKFYNCWQGWGVAEDAVKKGPVGPWKELLDFIFSEHPEEHRAWFEQWLAYPIQHPGTKLFQAVVLWGQPGTGKTLIGYTMKRLYGKNFTKVTERELHSAFNEWAEYKQFALGDEITGGDKRSVAEHLKDIITQTEININPKHIKQYTVPDCINWLFTSNHCDAFFVEDKDRRFFIIEVKRPPLPREFYKRYDAWYRSEAGAGALFHYFRNLDLTGFNPMDHAPQTRSKLEMIADGRSDIAAWCAELRENPDAVLINGAGQPIPRKLWTTTELFAIYSRTSNNTRLTVNGLARELKKAQFLKALNGDPFGYGPLEQGKTARAWLIRDVENLRRIKKPLQIGKLYYDEFRAWEETKLKHAAEKEKF